MTQRTRNHYRKKIKAKCRNITEKEQVRAMIQTHKSNWVTRFDIFKIFHFQGGEMFEYLTKAKWPTTILWAFGQKILKQDYENSKSASLIKFSILLAISFIILKTQIYKTRETNETFWSSSVKSSQRAGWLKNCKLKKKQLFLS